MVEFLQKVLEYIKTVSMQNLKHAGEGGIQISMMTFSTDKLSGWVKGDLIFYHEPQIVAKTTAVRGV